MIRAALILTGAILVISACGDSEPDMAEMEDSGTFGYAAEEPEFDSDDAVADASADLGTSTYSDVADTSLCTDDCGGHDAGFDWARDNDVTSSSDCYGQSQSFIEGCEAYAEEIEERVEEAESEFDPDAEY